MLFRVQTNVSGVDRAMEKIQGLYVLTHRELGLLAAGAEEAAIRRPVGPETLHLMDTVSGVWDLMGEVGDAARCRRQAGEIKEMMEEERLAALQEARRRIASARPWWKKMF